MPVLKLVGGPYDGKEHQLIAVPDELDFWLKEDGALYDDVGEVVRVARYVPNRNSDGTEFRFERFDASLPTLESIKKTIARDPRAEMTRRLYEKPDYRVYTLTPKDDHKQVELRHGNRYAQVDEKVAPLVLEAWKRGWETMGSCQERPPESRMAGWAYLDFPAPGHGRAFKQAMAEAGIPTDEDICDLTIGGRGRDGLVRYFVVAKLNVYVPTKDIDRAASYLRGEVT